MRYFYDTEFYERGNDYPIIPISIGIVAEDGREFYMEVDHPRREEIYGSEWLVQNVIPFLDDLAKPQHFVAASLTEFFDPHPTELWAYFADYDHVILAQLFGTMLDLPEGIPMWTHDLKQLMSQQGVVRADLPPQKGVEHNALADARWVKEAYDAIG